MHVASRLPLVLAGVAACFALSAAAAEYPNWDAVADDDTVSVITTNADGTQRYTTVWLVVVGGRGYLRTGDSTWGGNATRNPEVSLDIGGEQFPLRAELVEAEDERALVMRAFNEKYGWSDTVLGWFASAHPKILRLGAR